MVRSTGSIGTHALLRDGRRDDLAPVRLDCGREEGFRVGLDALAVRIGIIVDNASRWMYKVLVWAEMEVKGFPKGG
jgi:hypothetical protein